MYNPELKKYICSQGKSLNYLGIKRDTKGNYYRSYVSKVKDCKGCALLIACTGKSKFKKITESVDKQYYDEIHKFKEANEKKWKRMKKLRSSTVEPVLGTLINFTGMRRIYTRGIQNANKFMIGAAIAYNIKKWMNYKAKKANSNIAELSIPKIELNTLTSNVLIQFIKTPIFELRNQNLKLNLL